MTFDELKIAEPILKAIREKGYTTPTPIQEQAIPVAFEGRDIFGIAQTGTGKTAAFAIPIIQYIWEKRREESRVRNAARRNENRHEPAGSEAVAERCSDGQKSTEAGRAIPFAAGGKRGETISREVSDTPGKGKAQEGQKESLIKRTLLKLKLKKRSQPVSGSGVKVDEKIAVDSAAGNKGAVKRKPSGHNPARGGVPPRSAKPANQAKPAKPEKQVSSTGPVESAKSVKTENPKGVPSGKSNNKNKSRNKNSGGGQSANRTLRALILTPTRELALQIDECIRDYGKYADVSHCVIFGGVKQKPQTDQLSKGVDILVATPGRLLDLMGQGFINLDKIEHFVLDEADRMLDMGFINDIMRILPKLPKKRQTMFFSATMPDAIVRLSRSIVTDPVRIEVTPAASVVDAIDQKLYFVEKAEKRDLLIKILQDEGDNSVLVFARTKHGADKIAKTLSKAGIRTVALHGDKTQIARQQALGNFKTGRVKVMIATDIAARGIDINQLDIVINYDLPDQAETYVHRIGRTGRAGRSGKAYSFCSMEEHMMVNDIQKLTGKIIEAVIV